MSVTHAIFDSRTPFVVNGGIFVFALVFGKCMGFFSVVEVGQRKQEVVESPSDPAATAGAASDTSATTE